MTTLRSAPLPALVATLALALAIPLPTAPPRFPYGVEWLTPPALFCRDHNPLTTPRHGWCT
ncbi:hypothetical protein HDA39_006686 [Kribbella italica]|uniref:Uncharacterized protein n=1 Tax=Kribbella italica TaxID=1540520 RepID=A0A7W9JDT3_9ACTN|nr:hypothetical protein [Kribbella italica]